MYIHIVNNSRTKETLSKFQKYDSQVEIREYNSYYAIDTTLKGFYSNVDRALHIVDKDYLDGLFNIEINDIGGIYTIC